jgi:hypothetical protein
VARIDEVYAVSSTAAGPTAGRAAAAKRLIHKRSAARNSHSSLPASRCCPTHLEEASRRQRYLVKHFTCSPLPQDCITADTFGSASGNQPDFPPAARVGPYFTAAASRESGMATAEHIATVAIDETVGLTLGLRIRDAGVAGSYMDAPLCHTWTPPYAKHLFRFRIPGRDCSHTFGLGERRCRRGCAGTVPAA